MNKADEEIIINISAEEYLADLAQGLQEDELLKPGQHKFKRGGFLTRHGLTAESVQFLSIPPELINRAKYLARLHQKNSVEEWLTKIIQERIELEEAVFDEIKRDFVKLNALPQA